MSKIHELYDKERDYERCVFGEYRDDPSLSFASFIIFMEQYIEKAKKAYCGNWQKELPPWLKSCAEHKSNGLAPVNAYAEIIKVMALAGAALENYAEIDPDKWRENAEDDALKWTK